MEQDERVHEVAARLRKAEETGQPIAPVRNQLAPGSVEEAYAVQLHNTRVWQESGRRVVGRKIGLTSQAVQRQLNVDQPDFGVLFADMCFGDGEAVPAANVLQPRVEAEVAIVLGRDLPHVDTTVADVVSAVAYVLPAIEIVGSRIAGWDITIVDTIADNASCGAFVATVSFGSGAACLGHPYLAAVWLARRLAAEGAPLVAGDVVMTGALGPMVTLAPGVPVLATISGLGSVRTILEGA